MEQHCYSDHLKDFKLCDAHMRNTTTPKAGNKPLENLNIKTDLYTNANLPIQRE